MNNPEKIINAIMSPIDKVLGTSINQLEKLGLLQKSSDIVYENIHKLMKINFKLMNELKIEGTENVPLTGGVIFACNHQSWLDVQVLLASCPRRVHFIAKSEFQNWPVLRHMIKISESVFVRRKGDNNALDFITGSLENGWAVAIFPEGTIPGEEEFTRADIEPETGLLPGRTGVVRLALRGNVPIIPVGVSGTGRSLPPEIYPRMELLRLPSNTPISIKFGKPIYMDEYKDCEHNRELFRKITNRVMNEISGLVDHQSNYIPMEVPVKPPAKFEKIGVLLLHEFASDMNSVSGLLPYLKSAGIPYEIPNLRGHGTRYQEQELTDSKEWYADAERALISLKNKVDRVVIIGFGLGGLIGLDLAIRHPEQIAGLTTLSAGVKFREPFATLLNVASKTIKYWPVPDFFSNPTVKANIFNYEKFSTRAFSSLYNYSKEIMAKLPEVHVPLLIIQSRADQFVAPESANILYEKVSSLHRNLIWYTKSGHELMRDVESDSVLKDLMGFVNQFMANGKFVLPEAKVSNKEETWVPEKTAS